MWWVSEPRVQCRGDISPERRGEERRGPPDWGVLREMRWSVSFSRGDVSSLVSEDYCDGNNIIMIKSPQSHHVPTCSYQYTHSSNHVSLSTLIISSWYNFVFSTTTTTAPISPRRISWEFKPQLAVTAVKLDRKFALPEPWSVFMQKTNSCYKPPEDW